MEAHLNGSQIDQLLRLACAEEEPGPHQAHDERARLHLKSCAICQGRVGAEENVMQQLAQLKPGEMAARAPECPAGDVWLEVAAGISQHGENYLHHAAQCDHCGPLLHQAVADVADEPTAEEEVQIAALRVATPERQREIAASFGRSAAAAQPEFSQRRWRPSRPKTSWPAGLAFATVFAGLIGVAIWLPLHWRAKDLPNHLIANAYAEKRTLEVRIEGAPYVALRQERGLTSEQGRMSRPALLRAEAEIAQKLQSNPEDVPWLQASGRASLLENDAAGSQAAMAALEKAQRLIPSDPSIATDLASAYLLRGQFLNRPGDLNEAIEILGKVLSSHPDDETAQFNDAIALEKALLKKQAVEAWQKFLAQHPASPWAEEAKTRLSSLQVELRQHAGRSEAPLMTPEQVATAFEERNPEEISKLDQRIEEYQELAIQKWLPAFFSPYAAVGKREEDMGKALSGLAALLSERHHDRWLQELLTADRHSPGVMKAVSLLSDSTLKVETSDESLAQGEATEALSLFQGAHVPAGEMLARLVLLFAEQYQHRYRPCEALAQSMLPPASLTQYSWILIQVQLEDSICASVSDKQALQATQSALQLANLHHYPGLLLRANAIECGLYSALGDTNRASLAAAEGLQIYWNGTYPKLRGYNSLVLMEEINFPRDKWFLEAAILREAMPMVEGDSRTAMVAAEEARLGQTLLQAQDLEGARKSYQKVQSLLRQSSAGMQTEALSAEAQLGFAKVDLKRNRLSASLDRLERIRPVVMKLPDDPLLLDFYQTSGVARLRAGDLTQSEADLNAASKLAEQGLRLLETEDDRWKWSRQNEPIYRALVELKLHRDSRAALVDWEWYKGAALRSEDVHTRLSPLNPDGLSSPEELEVAFPGGDQTSVVSFVLFPKGFAVWVWNKSSLREQWVSIDESNLTSQITRFAEHCSNPGSDPLTLRQEGASLYREIILPIEPSLPARHHLIMEPDGALKGLPFELLVNPAGSYFGDQFAVTVSPGAAYLNKARAWTGLSSQSNAVVLGEAQIAGWTALPDAQREAWEVAASFQHPRLLTEVAVSTPHLSREIANADVIHFSGHAQTSVESANLVSGGLVMLSAEQLNAMRRGRNQLVVLSACSTSGGTTGLFDDDDSMVRRLMSARVPEVVASRWMVDSAATGLLMKIFYSELLKGKATAQALQTATRMVRANPGYSHPYYWAGFSVFGSS